MGFITKNGIQNLSKKNVALVLCIWIISAVILAGITVGVTDIQNAVVNEKNGDIAFCYFKLSLTNTIESTKNTLSREAKRANQDYAKKAISRAIFYKNDTLSREAWNCSAKYALGTGFSNFINYVHKSMKR